MNSSDLLKENMEPMDELNVRELKQK
jgi:hypothetical protein